MTAVDYVLLLIIGLSIVISAVRGLVREVLSLASWITAFFIAQASAPTAATWLPAFISHPGVRLALAFVAVLLVSVVVLGLLSLLICRLVKEAGLSYSDRVLGALFGLLRGIAIAIALVLAAGLTPLPRERAWQEAKLGAPLQAVALWIARWLPEDLRSRVKYN
ncbi:MAG TPA: CvpA family protein [Burkholderiales bacterium]|nr:CvpA family protein [Burkholderiales bacterium]